MWNIVVSETAFWRKSFGESHLSTAICWKWVGKSEPQSLSCTVETVQSTNGGNVHRDPKPQSVLMVRAPRSF